MTEREIPVTVRDAIGPLPSGESLLILSAGGKTFAIRCSIADADACSSCLGGQRPTIHSFVSEIMRVLDLAVSKAVIFKVDGELCCKVILKGWKKPIKLSTDSVGTGINLALGSGIVIKEGALSEMSDIESEYAVLKAHVPCLWPLAPLYHTPSLEILSNFLDAMEVRR